MEDSVEYKNGKLKWSKPMVDHAGRKWTPLSIAVLSVCMAAGFAFIGWCGDSAVNALKNQFQIIDEKQDIMFKKLSLIDDGLACTNTRLFACCGDKANIQCVNAQ